MSTNDTVLMLANGASGININNESKIVQQRFSEAINAICACLAKKCVTDGEKVTKFVKVKVKRAPNTESALKVARSISNSLLVKSSWYGSDPNWGRIIDAAGYAKVGIKFDQLSLNYNDCQI